MSRSNIRVEGVARAKAALARVGRGIETGAAAGTRTGLEAIAELARRHVAVDTGELLESIHLQMEDETHGEVTADAPHAGYVEFGTADTPPQPYMTPAGELGRQPFVKATSSEIKRRVR